MIKQELYTKIFKELWNEELLNEIDRYNITTLQMEVEAVISKVLEDYALVYKVGIISE